MSQFRRSVASRLLPRFAASLVPALMGITVSQLAEAQVEVCDPSTLYCSVDSIKPRYEHRERLQTSIDSGWIPECNPPTPNGHCGDKSFQVRAQIAFDPVGSGETAAPVFYVDMPKDATIQAKWPTTDFFELDLKPVTSPSGKFHVTHGLTPEFGLYLDLQSLIGVFGQTEINVDANDLINLIPGSSFNFVATRTSNFAPWGFTPTTMRLEGDKLENTRLFSITFQDLGDLVGSGDFTGIIEGLFSFNATAETDFTYQTTQVQITGATGSITSATGTTLVPMMDANYLELAVTPRGVMKYSGQLEMLPVITITKIAGFGITLAFPISVGLDFPFNSVDIPVNFPSQLIHIPLPNIFVPSSFVDFGQIETGHKADKKVTIDNTGELGAMLQFESSDPQFTTAGVASTQIGPEQQYDLTVSFRPTKAGAQRATITVYSNDPDSPVQEFEVMGFGTGKDLPPEEQGFGGSNGGGFGSGGTVTEDGGGCGCRVAQSTTQGSSAALLGLAGLLFLRRRRAAKNS